MADLHGTIEVAIDATGRDEETVQRFYDRVREALEREVAACGVRHSGITQATGRARQLDWTLRP